MINVEFLFPSVFRRKKTVILGKKEPSYGRRQIYLPEP